MNNLQEKRFCILESILNTANNTAKLAKEIPKKNKYFFTRKNIRGLSRQNKKKKAIALMNLQIGVIMGISQTRLIASTPIPKFQLGGRSYGKTHETMAWVGENGAEIISKNKL